MDVSKLQVEVIGWRIEAEAKWSRGKKIVEKRDIVTSNLKDLSLQYKRLGEQLKFASLRPSKKAKGPIENELKIAALEKEVVRLNIRFRRKKEKCRLITLQLRNKTLEATTLKVELRGEWDRNSKSKEQKRALLQKNYSRVKANIHVTKTFFRYRKREL